MDGVAPQFVEQRVLDERHRRLDADLDLRLAPEGVEQLGDLRLDLGRLDDDQFVA
jgi:hypothetical protein